MAKCRKCGRSISSRSDYCPYCGARSRGGVSFAVSSLFTLFGMIGAGMLLVSVFLPFASVSFPGAKSSMTLRELSQDSYPLFLIILAVLAIVMIPAGRKKLYSLSAVLVTALSAYHVWSLASEIYELDSLTGGASRELYQAWRELVNFEIGGWLYVIGTLIMLVCGIIFLLEKEKKRR